MGILVLSGKLLSVTMVMDGRGTKIFEIEINKNKYKFDEQLPFYDLHDLGRLQGKPIKLKGILNEDSNMVSDVSDVWIKLF